MQHGYRWIIIAAFLGLCAAYALRGGSSVVQQQTLPVAIEPIANTPKTIVEKKEPPPASAPAPIPVTPPATSSSPAPAPVATVSAPTQNVVRTITPHGQAESGLKISPLELDFGEVLVGESRSLTTTIENSAAHAVEITRIHVSCGCVKTEMRKQKIAPGQSETLTVTVTGMPGRRPEQYTIRITTDETTKPVLSVLVKVKIRQEFAVEPQTLDFGNVTIGETKTLTATLTRLDGKSFSLEKIEVKNPEFSFSQSPVEQSNGSAWLLSFTAKGIKAGAIVEAAALLTGHPRVPIVSLPLKAIVGGEVTSVVSVLTATPNAASDLCLFETVLKYTPVSARAGTTPPGGLKVESVRENDGLALHFTSDPVGSSACKLSITFDQPYTRNVPVGEFIVKTNAEAEPMRIPYRVLRIGGRPPAKVSPAKAPIMKQPEPNR